jgi:hypothetical protein
LSIKLQIHSLTRAHFLGSRLLSQMPCNLLLGDAIGFASFHGQLAISSTTNTFITEDPFAVVRGGDLMMDV